MRVIVSLQNLEKVFWYVIIPLLVILVLFYLFLFWYSRKKTQDIDRRNYVINYWSSVISVIFGATLLGIAIGFCTAFIRMVNELGIADQNRILYYIVMFFPLVPLAFFALFVRKFLKNLKNKELIERKEELK